MWVKVWTALVLAMAVAGQYTTIAVITTNDIHGTALPTKLQR